MNLSDLNILYDMQSYGDNMQQLEQICRKVLDQQKFNLKQLLADVLFRRFCVLWHNYPIAKLQQRIRDIIGVSQQNSEQLSVYTKSDVSIKTQKQQQLLQNDFDVRYQSQLSDECSNIIQTDQQRPQNKVQFTPTKLFNRKVGRFEPKISQSAWMAKAVPEPLQILGVQRQPKNYLSKRAHYEALIHEPSFLKIDLPSQEFKEQKQYEEQFQINNQQSSQRYIKQANHQKAPMQLHDEDDFDVVLPAVPDTEQNCQMQQLSERFFVLFSQNQQLSDHLIKQFVTELLGHFKLQIQSDLLFEKLRSLELIGRFFDYILEQRFCAALIQIQLDTKRKKENLIAEIIVDLICGRMIETQIYQIDTTVSIELIGDNAETAFEKIANIEGGQNVFNCLQLDTRLPLMTQLRSLIQLYQQELKSYLGNEYGHIQVFRAFQNQELLKQAIFLADNKEFQNLMLKRTKNQLDKQKLLMETGKFLNFRVFPQCFIESLNFPQLGDNDAEELFNVYNNLQNQFTQFSVVNRDIQDFLIQLSTRKGIIYFKNQSFIIELVQLNVMNFKKVKAEALDALRSFLLNDLMKNQSVVDLLRSPVSLQFFSSISAPQMNQLFVRLALINQFLDHFQKGNIADSVNQQQIAFLETLEKFKTQQKANERRICFAQLLFTSLPLRKFCFQKN